MQISVSVYLGLCIVLERCSAVGALVTLRAIISTHCGVPLALYPGPSQFFNDAHTKIRMREPGKIHHVHGVEDGRDSAWPTHTHSFLGLLLGEA